MIIVISGWGGRSDTWPATNFTKLIDFCINPPDWVCKGEVDKAKCSAFLASLFFCFWRFDNESLFESKHSIYEKGKLVDQLVLTFSGILQYNSSFESQRPVARWTAPAIGMRKVNCDVAFKDSKGALAFVVRNEACLFVVARTKLLCLSSAFETETKAIEWAIWCPCENLERNFYFSSDVLGVVNEINSSKEPRVGLLEMLFCLSYRLLHIKIGSSARMIEHPINLLII